jgi:hypothetical protein
MVLIRAKSAIGLDARRTRSEGLDPFYYAGILCTGGD